MPERKFNVDDYMNLPNDERYELIEGDLLVVPRPALRHQFICGNIIHQIKIYLESNDVGKAYQEVDVLLGDNVVVPDIVFISKDRMEIAGEQNVQGAPDLVIEILSPSSRAYDKKKKSKLYWRYGVKEYWLVDPDANLVEVYYLEEKSWCWGGVFDPEDVLVSNLMPGLELSVAKVFDD
jgi:Uma2 family endonuclease